MAEVQEKEIVDAKVRKKQSKNKRKRRGITFKLILMAIIPSICSIAALLFLSIVNLSSGLKEQVLDDLELLAGSIDNVYESKKGSYRLEGSKLFKGDTELTIDPRALDVYVQDSDKNVQLTLCYGKTRMITTLADEKGVRSTGTQIDDKVWEVVQTGKIYRDTSIVINGETYCVVYVPFMENDKVVGCVFAGQPTEYLNEIVAKKVINMLVVAVFVLIIVATVAFVIASSMAKAVKKASDAVLLVSEGNLDVQIDKSVTKRKDEIGEMGNALQNLVDKLREIVGGLLDSAQTLNTSGDDMNSMAEQSSVAANEISTAVEEISKGAIAQAEEIESATSEVISMGEEISKIVKNVADLSDTSKTMENAEQSSSKTMLELSDAVTRTTEAMSRISKQIETTNQSVNEIGIAASLIADIASQTSLLSLNASIESARAGEAGKGFAVVASEIQKLSNQSDSAANQIQNIITTLQAESYETLSVMKETEVLVSEQYEKLMATKEKFGEVSRGINVSKQGTEVIKGNAETCNDARTNVVDVISNLSAISEENAASTEETTSSMEELNSTIAMLAEMAARIKDISVKLNEDMNFFKM